MAGEQSGMISDGMNARAKSSANPVAARMPRTRLRDAGRNVRFVELRGDDHWLSDAETRIRMLRELETFLAANIGPRPAS